jgi:hypothetical protein
MLEFILLIFPCLIDPFPHKEGIPP